MRLQVSLLTVLFVALTACTPSPSPKPAERGSDEGTKNEEKSPTPSETPKPIQSTGIDPGPQSDQLDVVIVNAIGSENSDQASRQRDEIKGFLSDLAKLFQNRDVRIALIGSPNATISGVSTSLDSSLGFTSANSTQLNFELAPKDALLGTLISACSPESTNVDSSHAPGFVTVCGTRVDIPAHSWTWGVDDLKGRLVSFLRPGAKRTFIIFTSNASEVVSGNQFIEIATKQNAQKSVRVFAVAPLAIGETCNNRNKRASAIEEATRNSGKIYSYCQVSWSKHLTDILSSL